MNNCDATVRLALVKLMIAESIMYRKTVDRTAIFERNN